MTVSVFCGGVSFINGKAQCGELSENEQKWNNGVPSKKCLKFEF